MLLILGWELLRQAVFSSWFLPHGAQHMVGIEYVLNGGSEGGRETDFRLLYILRLCYLM